MSPADIIGFFLDLAIDPLSWLFIIFWGIYKTTKKNWAKKTAIVFTIIAVMNFVATCDSNFTHIITK